MPETAKHISTQSRRTMWSSIELFAATFVANAPTIYSLLRRKNKSNSSRSQSNSGYVHGGTLEPSRVFVRKGRGRADDVDSDTYHMGKYGLRMPKSTSDEVLTVNAAATGVDPENPQCNP